MRGLDTIPFSYILGRGYLFPSRTQIIGIEDKVKSPRWRLKSTRQELSSDGEYAG
jgi:hypothetical protein